MSDSINFDALLTKRKALHDDMKVREFSKHIVTLAMAINAFDEVVKMGQNMDELLRILRNSAVKNGDTEALFACEMISRKILGIR